MLETNKQGLAVETIEFNAWRDLLEVMPGSIKDAIAADHRIVGGQPSAWK